MASLFWLSDAAWATIEPHLLHGKLGKPHVDDRRVISGILHVIKTGCRWRDVPADYGPPTTVHNRYHRSARAASGSACSKGRRRRGQAAMRAAFASMTWRWKSYDEENEAEHARFEAKRAEPIDAAVVAEIVWLDGGAEPAWPTWPMERPHLRRCWRIRAPGPVTPAEFEEDEVIEIAVAEPPSIIYFDSTAAAQWLAMVQAAPRDRQSGGRRWLKSIRAGRRG